MRTALLIAFLFSSLSPVAYAAEELPAGFAPGSVWLSTNAPVEGETVEIYTVIFDASGTALEGSVTFLIDDESVGSSPFTLRGGKTEIRSIRWQATAGTHTLAARVDTAIQAESKQQASLQYGSTATTTITVTEKEPELEEEEPRARERTTDIVSVVTNTPVVGQVLGASIALAESVRTAGESALASYVGEDPATSTEEMGGIVLGTTTEDIEEEPSTPSLTSRAAGFALTAFRAPALFYPIAIFLILFGFWLIARQVRNPNKRRRRRR